MSGGAPPPSPVPVVQRVGKLRVLRRLFGLVAPYRWHFAAATASLLFGSGLGLLYPQGAKLAVDFAMAEGSTSRLDLIALGLLALFAVSAAFQWARHYLMSWLGERVVADLRRRVYQRLLGLPLSWFHERRTGEVTGRLASDVATLQSVVGSELSMSMREMVTLVGGVAFLAYENLRLTLVTLGIVPPVVLGVYLFGRRIRRMSKEVQDTFATTSAQVQESIAAIHTVQSFVREETETARYAERVEAYFADVMRLAVWRGGFYAAMTFSGSVALAAVVWFGGRAVIDGDLTPGDLVAFLLYTMMVGGALAGLAGLWGSLQRAAGATERLFEILDEEPSLRDPPRPSPLPSGGGAIRFEGVDFAYPTRPGELVLKGIDLDVKAGEVIALVGRSGAGKSTLTALVQRFYDPSSGRVLFEGADVRELRLKELRGCVAVVAQEPVLFSGTLKENIAYGRPGATDEQIVQAAKEAHAHEFITSFPEGYDAMVGERGVMLSGGQRQRVAIARALLADPRVLILDEATSNLDSESEALVQEALGRLMKGRTTLVVAHRLSTVREADRIVVLDKGRIEEIGSHAELMRARGLYARLVEHQLIFAEDGAQRPSPGALAAV